MLFNAVVLQRLVEIDILAALSLTNTSSSLSRFILNTLVSVPMVCKFLRENQYTLFHDIDHLEFSSSDILLIVRAITVFQGRHNHDELFMELREYLGILLARVPKSILFNEEMLPLEELLNSDGTYRHEEAAQQSVKHWVYTNPTGEWYGRRLLSKEGIRDLQDAYTDFIKYPHFSLHVPTYRGTRHFSSNFLATGKSSHPYLREQILFCSRYINEVISTRSKCKILFTHYLVRAKGLIFSQNESEIAEAFQDFDRELVHQSSTIFIPLWYRRTLVGELINRWFEHQALGTAFENRGSGLPLSDAIFDYLFSNEEWKKTHDISDIGWLVETGVSFDTSSMIGWSSKVDTLVWLLLGLHDYNFVWDASNECCPRISGEVDSKDILNFMADFSLEDKLNAVIMIIRKASEFGVCKHIGGGFLRFFVFPAKDHDVDVIVSAIFREVIQSSRAHNLLTGMDREIRFRKRSSLLSLTMEQTQIQISKLRSKFKGFEILLSYFTAPVSGKYS